MTDNIYVCDKVEFMTLPNFKTFNCYKCDALIGMTKAGYERYLKIKNIKVVCHECFWKEDYGKVSFKNMDKKQMKELKNYIPDLTKERMEKIFSKIESIKNKIQ